MRIKDQELIWIKTRFNLKGLRDSGAASRARRYPRHPWEQQPPGTITLTKSVEILTPLYTNFVLTVTNEREKGEEVKALNRHKWHLLKQTACSHTAGKAEGKHIHVSPAKPSMRPNQACSPWKTAGHHWIYRCQLHLNYITYIVMGKILFVSHNNCEVTTQTPHMSLVNDDLSICNGWIFFRLNQCFQCVSKLYFKKPH